MGGRGSGLGYGNNDGFGPGGAGARARSSGGTLSGSHYNNGQISRNGSQGKATAVRDS